MHDNIKKIQDNGMDIRGTLELGKNVSIDSYVIFKGKVIIEDNVQIGPFCIIEDAYIKAGTIIKEYTTITQSEIGERCIVGPYARIRPNTHLANEVHIGNFVEIKNSTIDTSCKINHHAFVGDATLGKCINIGAGTITCNYDNGKINRTVIEDDAFVGAGVLLIAPIVVEKGAFVGAGSTITKRAPGNALTISRAKQIMVENWVSDRN